MSVLLEGILSGLLKMQMQVSRMTLSLSSTMTAVENLETQSCSNQTRSVARVLWVILVLVLVRRIAVAIRGNEGTREGR